MIESDVKATVRLCLDRDIDSPADRRPMFVFRVLRRRQSRAIARILEELGAIDGQVKLSDVDRLYDQLETVLQASLVGWENQRDEGGKLIPFLATDLDRCVDDQEMVQLAMKLRVACMLGVADMGNSESPSPSALKTSADTAAAADV